MIIPDINEKQLKYLEYANIENEFRHHTDDEDNYQYELIKQGTGIKLSDYIMNKRIETAKNMLRYSDYSYSEIAAILAFSS